MNELHIDPLPGQWTLDELAGEREDEPAFTDLDETAMPEVDEETGEVLEDE